MSSCPWSRPRRPRRGPSASAEYQYSNAGLTTAGRLIEVVSGMPYEKFLDERLFRPLGLKDTTFWPTARQLKRLAKCYKPDAAKTNLVEIDISPLRYPLPEGGRGTVREMTALISARR